MSRFDVVSRVVQHFLSGHAPALLPGSLAGSWSRCTSLTAFLGEPLADNRWTEHSHGVPLSAVAAASSRKARSGSHVLASWAMPSIGPARIGPSVLAASAARK